MNDWLHGFTPGATCAVIEDVAGCRYVWFHVKYGVYTQECCQNSGALTYHTNSFLLHVILRLIYKFSYRNVYHAVFPCQEVIYPLHSCDVTVPYSQRTHGNI